MSNPQDDGASLLGLLRQRIARHGPMPVDEYMRTCTQDPGHGYWRRAPAIGAEGDFITAPEISQVFGELIGLWSVITWETMGRPAPLRLIELGPGRGTLMRDALRAARSVPQFLDAATVHLVEISAPLRAMQEQALAPWRSVTSWHQALDAVPTGASVVIANEFLDALPIRQLVYTNDSWHERVVDLAPEGRLQFAIGPRVTFRTDNPPRQDVVLELRPGEDELVAVLAGWQHPFVALFIDYGPAQPSFGDTLQAVRRHAYADPLSGPGTTDLTAHVQFAELAAKVRAAGLAAYGPITQAEFLGRLGVVERAQRLMTHNPERAGEIEASIQRLMSPSGMGGLFKALAVCPQVLPPPLPFG